MSVHTKMHRTNTVRSKNIRANYLKITLEMPKQNPSYIFIRPSDFPQVEKYLKKHSISEETNKSIEWKKIAKDRIEKYKKAGIVLRGARYRENCSQKELAQKSNVSQNDISKIENGKRTVGVEVAKRLAKALNFDYHLLLD